MFKIALGTTLLISTLITSSIYGTINDENEHELKKTKMAILEDIVQKEWLELPAEKTFYIKVYDKSGQEIIAKPQNKLSNHEKSILRKSDFMSQYADQKIFYLDN